MLKVKIGIAALAIVLLSGCSIDTGSPNDMIFPETKWGMSQDAVLTAYPDAQEDKNAQIKETSYLSLADIKLFGVKAEGVTFQFHEKGTGEQGLYEVMVSYPEDIEMQKVLAELKKEYGNPIINYSVFDSIAGEGKLEERLIEETDHNKQFVSSKSLWTEMTEEQKTRLQEQFTNTYPDFEDQENWNNFLKKVPTAVIMWTDDFSYSDNLSVKLKTSKNKVIFSANGRYTMDKYLIE